MDDFTRLRNCDDFGTQDPRAPVSKRARTTTAGLFRYMRIMDWARHRYTVRGYLCTVMQGEPTAYTRIERAAWARYAA